MTIKLVTCIATVFALMTGSAIAHTSYNAPQSTKNTEAVAATAGKKYIHRPDSTQYHPGNGVTASEKKPAPATAGKKYIHRPDSTQYHPGNGVTASEKKPAPATAGKKYIHKPDSTQYHPKNQKE